MRSGQISSAARGFSLIEVLVALIVVSIGLLGIAKMQAIAFSSTGVASKRTLAAIQAASLASSMHANRAYWSVGGVAPVTTTIVGSAVTASTDPALLTPVDCTNTGALPCTAQRLAAERQARGLAANHTLDLVAILQQRAPHCSQVACGRSAASLSQ